MKIDIINMGWSHICPGSKLWRLWHCLHLVMAFLRLKFTKKNLKEPLCCDLVEKWRERRKTLIFGDLFRSDYAGLSLPWKCVIYYLCPSCCLSGKLRRNLDVLHLGSRWILGRTLIGLRCPWDPAQSPRSSWSHAPSLNFHRRWTEGWGIEREIRGGGG